MSPVLNSLAAQIEKASALDAPAARLRALLDTTMQGPVKTALRGDWSGHTLHPALIQVPLGTFVSALVLDVLRGDEDASATLIAVGLAATPPALATGWSDWHDEEQSNPAVRRAGLVHAVFNVAGIGLHVASLLARRRGDRQRGAALSRAGLGAMGAGGWLGGHLAYARGSRVSS